MFCGASCANKGMLPQQELRAKDREALPGSPGPENVMSLWYDLRNDTFQQVEGCVVETD